MIFLKLVKQRSEILNHLFFTYLVFYASFLCIFFDYKPTGQVPCGFVSLKTVLYQQVTSALKYSKLMALILKKTKLGSLWLNLESCSSFGDFTVVCWSSLHVTMHVTGRVFLVKIGSSLHLTSIKTWSLIIWFFGIVADCSMVHRYAFKCHRKSEAGRDIVYPVNAIAFHPM